MELATAARGRGLIHAAHGDWASALAELADSLAHLDRLGWPFERARTQLALGIILRRAKHKRAARDTLHDARAIFDRLGARLWSAKAATELARIGGRTPTSGATTATEREVAVLVAGGYTNREVADRLFVSAKTVAGHLTRSTPSSACAPAPNCPAGFATVAGDAGAKTGTISGSYLLPRSYGRVHGLTRTDESRAMFSRKTTRKRDWPDSDQEATGAADLDKSAR